MTLDDLSADGETEPGTAIIGGGFTGLYKHIEYFFKLVRRYANTLISDDHFNCRGVVRIVDSVAGGYEAVFTVDYKLAIWRRKFDRIR
jgi:hypothetical protein